MLKKFLILSLFSFSAIFSFAQSGDVSTIKVPGRTSFFAEVGGPGILFSANFDTRFKKSHLGWGGRIGLGFVSFYEDNYVSTPGGGYYTNGSQLSVVTFPLQVNHIFGKANSPHTFEAGAGITILGKRVDVFDNFNDTNKTALFGNFSFMYRRQPVNGGFTWRIGFTPLVSNGYIQPSGAAGVGYNF